MSESENKLSDICPKCGDIYGWHDAEFKCPTLGNNKLWDYVKGLEIEIGLMKRENENLKKIIAKELSENDELGCEFVYVTIGDGSGTGYGTGDGYG